MLALYRRLRYPVGHVDLVHGVHDPRVDALLDAHGATTGTYVTAWNPRGVAADPKLNAAANERLRAELERLAEGILDAPGASGEGGAGDWTPERSFFALGLSREAAMALGRRYDQLAIVFVERGGAAMVLAL